jgi:hypothetical protein
MVKAIPHRQVHVLMNQIGNLCNRYNHRITGTNPQQNWVQCLVAKQCGVSYDNVPLSQSSGMELMRVVRLCYYLYLIYVSTITPPPQSKIQ